MLKQMVQRVLYPAAADIHLTDGFPISVCMNCRVSRRKIFKSEDEVSWGFCASKQQPYFGFHGHVVTNLRDEIVAFALTPANVDERSGTGSD
jgi:Transposase DDE domain